MPGDTIGQGFDQMRGFAEILANEADDPVIIDSGGDAVMRQFEAMPIEMKREAIYGLAADD